MWSRCHWLSCVPWHPSSPLAPPPAPAAVVDCRPAVPLSAYCTRAQRPGTVSFLSLLGLAVPCPQCWPTLRPRASCKSQRCCTCELKERKNQQLTAGQAAQPGQLSNEGKRGGIVLAAASSSKQVPPCSGGTCKAAPGCCTVAAHGCDGMVALGARLACPAAALSHSLLCSGGIAFYLRYCWGHFIPGMFCCTSPALQRLFLALSCDRVVNLLSTVLWMDPGQ